jgi:hypothetical protein
MAVLFANDAEAQVSGTAVAADGSNTGDVNSVAFDGSATGTNMTLTMDNANPAHGTNAYKAALTSTATAATYLDVTGAVLGTPVSTMFGACYLTIHNAISSSVRWIGFFNGSTIGGYLGLTNGLQGPQWRSIPDTAVGTAGPALTADTLYRIEFMANFGGGTATAKVFAGDSTIQTGSDQTASFAWAISTCDHVRFGINTANFSLVAGQYIAMDDIQLNTDGYPGPGPYTTGPPTAIPYPTANKHVHVKLSRG